MSITERKFKRHHHDRQAHDHRMPAHKPSIVTPQPQDIGL
jgi:hypothetical protein